MEHMQGGSVGDRVREGPLPEVDAIRHGRDAAAALWSAHQKGIHHRDIKPANLLLTADGRVKVADFGIASRSSPLGNLGTDPAARTTQDVAPAPAGTPGYIPPEVFLGRAQDQLGDQFAFGVTLHEMLSGKHPLEGLSWQDAAVPGYRLEPTLPADLRSVIERCIASKRADRFPDMGEVLHRLEAALERRERGRRGVGWSLVGAVVTTLVLAGGWWWYQDWQRKEARQEAMAEYQLGMTAMNETRTDDAAVHFMTARDRDPTFDAPCNNLAWIEVSKGKLQDALNVLRSCAQSLPESPLVHLALGRVLGDRGEFPAAEQSLRKALDLDPSQEYLPYSWNELAMTLINLERPQEAVSLLQPHAPFSEDLIGVPLRKTLGLALLRSGRSEEARQVLRSALDIALRQASGPGWDQTLVAVGQVLAEAGEIDAAVIACSEALVLPGTQSVESATICLKGLPATDP
jgi:Flp pilus assembly protein TadD